MTLDDGVRPCGPMPPPGLAIIRRVAPISSALVATIHMASAQG
jgi:hypothetical protein